MKNFIRNNFYSVQEFFDKVNDLKYGYYLFTFMLFILLNLIYFALLFIGIIAFIKWDFNLYEVYLRTLFVCIILNILIFKK